tara:strand:+ start:475 stop:774 length:300 start_codon:yes stop_codon:yes gene_type:complete
MAAYMLVTAEIYDAKEFAKYSMEMSSLISTYKGEYLAKGNISAILEGYFDKKKKILIAKYPSIKQIHDMWNSEEYKKIKKLRQNIAKVDVILIDGLNTN